MLDGSPSVCPDLVVRAVDGDEDAPQPVTSNKTAVSATRPIGRRCLFVPLPDPEIDSTWCGLNGSGGCGAIWMTDSGDGRTVAVCGGRYLIVNLVYSLLTSES